MQRSANTTFNTPPLKVTTLEDGSTQITSDFAPGKIWVNEDLELATLAAREELETMFKQGTLGNNRPSWADEFGAREKKVEW